MSQAEGAAPHRRRTRPAPQWQDNAAQACSLCGSRFSFVHRRHHCRNCGSITCAQCSRARWESRCVPPGYNLGGHRRVRVCTQCDRQAMQFKVALESGDVQRLAVNRDFISETLPLPHAHGACAVHVAAGAGRLGAVDWLAEHPEVDLGVEDDAGRTPLAVAAKNMHIEVARALTHQYGRSVTEVRDVAVLQRLAARVIMPRGLGVGASAGSAKTMSPPGVRGEGERASMCDSEAAAPDRDSMMERSCSGAGHTAGATAGEEAAEGRGAGAHAPCAVASDKVSMSESRGAGECIVCWERGATHCLVPCGHLVYCAQCLPANPYGCPVCRARASNSLRVFKP